MNNEEMRMESVKMHAKSLQMIKELEANLKQYREDLCKALNSDWAEIIQPRIEEEADWYTMSATLDECGLLAECALPRFSVNILPPGAFERIQDEIKEAFRAVAVSRGFQVIYEKHGNSNSITLCWK